MSAVHGSKTFPPIPASPFAPAMQVEVPCERLTAQWKLGVWHILRRSVQDPNGKWHFNDHPFGVLAGETNQILRALDHLGMHKEAGDGLDQWLSLPVDLNVVPGEKGHLYDRKFDSHHEATLPDRPLGLFSEGRGCFTNAEGAPGRSGHMDGVHAQGPGAIMIAMNEHFRLTGDMDWLREHAPRMKANAEWILRQRQLTTTLVPGGQRLWSVGLQPALLCSPDPSCGAVLQFFTTDALYWLAVKRMAELLSLVDRREGTRMAVEAEAYRRDFVAALDRAIALTPVVPVRDGTYRSYIPFGPYVRGFAAGPWSWKRASGLGPTTLDVLATGHVVFPAGVLNANDPRAQGYLDVLEDRLLIEVKKSGRITAIDPDRDWYSFGGTLYLPAQEPQVDIHLETDDIAVFLRGFYNCYAALVDPDAGYTFRECPFLRAAPDKIFEEAGFLTRFRRMLVMEDGDSLWLARATPRVWLAQGKKIAIKNAPTHFGRVAYEIVSDVDDSMITATVNLHSPKTPKEVLLRLRHPKAAAIESVTVNGKAWRDFDPSREIVRLDGATGRVRVSVVYAK